MTKTVVHLALLAVVLLNFRTPAHGQDVSKELQEYYSQGGTITKVVLQSERDVLRVIQQRVDKELEMLLGEYQEMRAMSASEAGLDSESTLTLMRNCLVELQKLRWDEATEKAIIEQWTAEKQTKTEPLPDVTKVGLEYRIQMLTLDLKNANEALEQAQVLYKKAVISNREMREFEIAVERRTLELREAEENLGMHKDIIASEQKSPLNEATKRLAIVVAKRKTLEMELDELRKAFQQVKAREQDEWKLSLMQKQIEQIQERQIPISSRLTQIDAILDHIQSTSQKNAEADAPK
jgi:hypothetical protein